MEEQKRSGLEDAASIAHTVKGAIQTGKAIAGATKGAAVGGPYGAVAGAVWGAAKNVPSIFPSREVSIWQTTNNRFVHMLKTEIYI